ncbi:hypothetical protein C0995_014542 [Termitomyces sp. Mi166|nr:hypothetical protein C0995_014542 [Termitomyces sp. Mi166\
MPGGLSISQMKPILNSGTWPEERTFASGAFPLLIYPELPEHIGQRRRSLDSLSQFGEMVQGSTYVHSMPFRPPQTAPLQTEVVGEDQSLMHTMQYQMINPDWMGRNDNAASEVEQVPFTPPAGSNQEKNGQKPLMRHKSLPGVLVEEPDQESSDKEEDGQSRSTLSVQLWLVLDHFPTVTKELTQKCLQLYMVKHMQLLANRGQNVPMADLTEYIELFTHIFELELNEYIKRKAAQGTALSTAMPAESVDYDAIRCQRVPVIAEVMDMLNALQQANESQQDFERRQNAVCRQATASGVPLWALSEVETATSKVVDEEEFEILQLLRTPRHHVMIKEEIHECTVPDETVTSQLSARHVPLVKNWNECVNYQRMRNHDLQILGKSLIDDQGVVFEGCGGVMPVDDMR